MHHLIRTKRSPAIAAAIAVVLAGLLLAACGSSSSSGSSSPANASASTSATTGAPSSAPGAPGGPGGPSAGGRFAGLRECLQKNGIALPKRTPGQGGPGAGGGLLGGGGRPLPAGVSREQFEAAVKKCGGTPRAHLGAGARFSTPAAKAALTRFAACMRENGQNVAPPNTSGKGPVFSISGLNTTSAAFKAARSKCANLLSGLFARPNAAAPPAAG